MAQVKLQYFARLVRAEDEHREANLINELLEPIEHLLSATALFNAEVLQLIDDEDAEMMRYRKMIDAAREHRRGHSSIALRGKRAARLDVHARYEAGQRELCRTSD